jgi:hypothetical protein
MGEAPINLWSTKISTEKGRGQQIVGSQDDIFKKYERKSKGKRIGNEKARIYSR